MVEFALVLPILVLVILALFDLGRGVIAYSELANASRVGARVAIVNQSNDANCAGPNRTFKCAAAETATVLGIDAADVPNLVITGSDCRVPSACTATVRLDHTLELITPIIGAIVGDVALSATTTMPLERTYPIPATP